MNSGSLARFILIALVFLLLSAAPVHAVDFNNIDTYAKLRDAITEAVGNLYADTINITADITLEDDLPTIGATVTINGDGGKFIIDGDGKYRPFYVNVSGILTLNNLIIDRAYIGGSGHAQYDHGASIKAEGVLTLNRVTVRNGSTSTTASLGLGAGGIHFTGSDLDINNSAIHNNSSYANGGGIRIDGIGTTTIVNTSIYGNSSGSRGGGIYMGATGTPIVRLYQVTITGNTTTNAGGSASSNPAAGLRANGGTLHLRNSIIYGNTFSGNQENCRIGSSVTVSALSGNIIGGGSDSTCTASQTTDDPDLAGPSVHSLGNFYIPRADSPAIDAVTCLASSIDGYNVDQRGEARPNPPGETDKCDIGAIEHAGYTPPPPPTQIPAPSRFVGGDDGSSPSSASDSSDDEANQAAVAVIRYLPAQSCQTLQPDIVVSDASSGTSCQRVEGSEIGHPDVIAAMPSLVVDIWGWVTPDTRVCFRADSGSIKFIDTTMLPRKVADLPVFSEPGGLLCATINGAGQVALVPGPPAPPVAAEPLAADELSDCMVRTQYMLNFRAAPGGEIIDILPFNIKLTAMERSAGFFKVDYMGAQGWVSEDLVELLGTCG